MFEIGYFLKFRVKSKILRKFKLIHLILPKLSNFCSFN